MGLGLLDWPVPEMGHLRPVYKVLQPLDASVAPKATP